MGVFLETLKVLYYESLSGFGSWLATVCQSNANNGCSGDKRNMQAEAESIAVIRHPEQRQLRRGKGLFCSQVQVQPVRGERSQGRNSRQT